MIFNVGDKVLYSSPNYLITDREGEDMYKNLKDGNKYIVSIVGIICLRLEGIGGVYLKEHFRKI